MKTDVIEDKLNPIFFSMISTMMLKMIFARNILFSDAHNIVKLFTTEIWSILLVLILFGFIFYKRNFIGMVFANIICSTYLLVLIMYYSYYGAIPTYTSLLQIYQIADVSDSILSIFRFSFLLLYADIIIFIILSIKYRITKSKLYISKQILACIVGIALLITSINFLMVVKSQIVNELKQAEKVGLLNYQLLRVYLDNKYKNMSKTENNLINIEKLNELKGIDPNAPKNYYGITKNKNIIVVQLEAFQNFPINLQINGQEITPNLNKLIKSSFYFPRFYQQIGKGNTSDAEFMLNTSIYPVGDKAMSQSYSNDNIPSLPKLLKNFGYESITFHTNDVEFWDRHKMYPALGFDNYYDRSFFGDEDIIAFGASDEVLYDKSITILEEITNKGHKFYANYISMSSHHPFKIPEDKRKIKLPEKYNGTMVGDYIIAVNYADYALGKFIKALEEKGLLHDTLLVIYGDHFGLQLDTEKDKILIRELIQRDYNEYVDGFNVPLIIKIPGQGEAERFNLVGGQIDIMPTIANLVGVSLDNIVYFGRDLLNSDSNLLGNRFYLPTGSFINNDVLFIPGEGFESGKMIDLNNLEVKNADDIYRYDYDKVLELMKISDLYINKLMETDNSKIKPYDWVQDNILIAHALGGIDGNPSTNSMEALYQNYDKGYRVFEADLILTKDNYLVARHDWLPYLYNFLGQKIDETKMQNALTLEEFKNLKIHNKYTPVDIKDIFQFMDEHEGVYLVTDKIGMDKDTIEQSFRILVDTANTINPSLLDRVIVQIYNEEMFYAIKEIYPFKNIIYTLYMTNATDDEIINFAVKNDIKVVTMSEARYSSKFVSELKTNGIFSYVHTINNLEDAKKYLIKGVHGLYSDFIDKSELIKAVNDKNITKMKITSIEPSEIKAGEKFYVFEGKSCMGVRGENFSIDSIIYVNDVPQETTFGGADYITIFVPDEFYEKPGKIKVQVKEVIDDTVISESNVMYINVVK